MKNLPLPPVLETAILEMGRQKGEEPFEPSDVVKWIYPQDWELFLVEVWQAMQKLAKEGKIIIVENGDEPMGLGTKIKILKQEQ